MKQIVLIMLWGLLVSATQAQTIDEPYDFPVRPGTEEWKHFKTYEERLNAYNIPNDLLTNMSTKGLVESCLHYPELRLVMTRNNLQHGYSYIASIFNGFIELERRKDAGKELLRLYRQLDPADITKFATPLERGKFAFQFTYMELILAQKNILANMEIADKKELAKICIANYESKKILPDEYATFGLATPAWVLGRILDVDSYPEFITKKANDPGHQKFIDYAYASTLSLLSDIITISKAYVQN